jgi:MFS family permease
VVEGRLDDRFGRKRIYVGDLLVFAFGVLPVVFAANLPVLFAGCVIVGLAVGHPDLIDVVTWCLR